MSLYLCGMRKKIICSTSTIMGGTPVFAGTRVPVQTLIDYLEGGESIDDFLDGFPTVTREQVAALLKETGKRILNESHDKGRAAFSIGTESDGLPVIRPQSGAITAALVREIEGFAR